MNELPWNKLDVPENSNLLTSTLADTENIIDFYWAKNFFNQPVLVIDQFEYTEKYKVPDFENIELFVKNKKLLLVLKKKSEAEIFHILCRDIINSTKFVSNRKTAFSTIFERLIKWQDLLKANKHKIDKKMLKGLAGELIFMRDHLLKEYKADEVLAFWQAPEEDSVHDFVICDTALEVKTRGSKNIIHISSFEQMQTQLKKLFLYVVTLSESSASNANSFNIFDLIDQIKKLLADERLVVIFEQMLLNYGFVGLAEYENFYLHKGSEDFYRVNEGFPKINHKPRPVTQLKYTIDLNYCTNYKTDTLRLKEEICH